MGGFGVRSIEDTLYLGVDAALTPKFLLSTLTFYTNKYGIITLYVYPLKQYTTE
jgi:hypothetical protein